MTRLLFALTAIAITAATATPAFSQPATDDFSEQVVHIQIGTGCTPYTWPVTTTPGGIGHTKWHDIAVQEICRQYPQQPLAFDVRGDGRVIALNQVDFSREDRFFADAYHGATFLASPVRVTITAAAR